MPVPFLLSHCRVGMVHGVLFVIRLDVVSGVCHWGSLCLCVHSEIVQPLFVPGAITGCGHDHTVLSSLHLAFS